MVLCVPSMFLALGSSLLFTLAMSVSTALAQCSLAGYIAAFSTNGTVIGALGRTLPFQGILTIDETSIRSNYLGVIGFSTSTPSGDAVLLQILSPPDPSAPYISMVISQTSCGALPIPNGDAPWIAQLVPADGFPSDQNGNQHSLIVVHDITNNRVAVSPSLASYTAAASGPVKLEEVFFAFVT
ncbi:hypothetical protein B0H16DRAFT_1551767 [Mycena metata]|uniref:Uncharacterized protein n=1 Tax=Mycena metata TaxID=1033252 RepID=A0AAD7IUS0_9AGAR|nr:hypothetical protein B0H16DRAFT_1551767 [Mycena metata]